ncbi:MAG: PA2778 family cysteine peptidase [Pseudomonadota bacterium]
MSKVTGVIALALILVLGGCTAPQTRELTSAWPEELEGQAELDFVPFFPQSRYQCGPAALATVLTVQGIDVTPEDLVGEVYVPERQGTLRTELISAARARGLIAYPIEPELSALFEALDARRPVLVMQNLGLDWVPQWHFAVAVGYDRASRELVLRSGTIARHVVSFSTFENTWERSDYWGIVVAEPRSPPVGVAPLNYLHAAHARYSPALHWFHSKAISARRLSLAWHEWLVTHPQIHRLKGQPVYLGDGIKVSKEGRKMPGVKRLHQESENVTKAEWIRGHYFGAITLLLEAGSCLFAVPVTFELQDGIKTTKDDKSTVVDKMSALCTDIINAGSYIILDAYFASKKLLCEFREHNLHLITRVRINTVAKHPKPAGIKRGRGRPRTWGESVKLRNLFNEEESFTRETLPLYGKMVTLKYRSIELHWDCPHNKVRFVLAVWPSGKQIILLSTDVTLSPTEIVTAYSLRFNIYVTFRSFIQLLSGFSYRFWMKGLRDGHKT